MGIVIPHNKTCGIQKPYLFDLISGAETAERFEVLNDVVEARAPNFFRLDTGLSIAPIPDTDEKRLWFLRLTLRELPDLEKESLDWVNNKSNNSVGKIHSLQNRKVKFPKNLIKEQIELPETYLEAYKVPIIRYQILNHAVINGDPATAVIKKYEYWRVGKEVEERNIINAKRAYDNMLFAAGGAKFLNMIKEKTIEEYSDSIDLRDNETVDLRTQDV